MNLWFGVRALVATDKCTKTNTIHDQHYKTTPQDYDDNDPDMDTETYPVNGIDHHPLIDCAGGGGGGEEETERTTLLGQSMLASRPGND